MKWIKAGLVSISLLGLLLVVWAFWLEPASLQIKEYTIDLSGSSSTNKPAKGRTLRIAVLADLHTGSPYHGLEMLDRIVELSHSASPDLILLAGDFVIQGVLGGRFVEPEETAKRLAKLQANYGVYAVLGNHDWWLDEERVAKAFTEHGIQMMEDRAIPLPIEDSKIWLAGISDFWEGPHDVDQALQAVPADARVIAFTHNPDIFPELPPRIELTIAGHTHGGQVNLPFFGRLIVPSKFSDRYAIGHIIEDGRSLFVTPGLGTNILPVRFRVPPEISLLTVQF